MVTSEGFDFGVVRFMPIESYTDPTLGLDREARVDLVARIVENYLAGKPVIPQSEGDWSRVHTAIRRAGLFVIETRTPCFAATLRFCPDRAGEGDYEIHRQPRFGVERGRTVRVSVVADDEANACAAMLKPFATRFCVVTVRTDRPHTKLIWLVGLRDFRSFDETAETASARLAAREERREAAIRRRQSNRLERSLIISQLSLLEHSERLSHIVGDTRHPVAFYPEEWAIIDSDSLQSLPSELRRALIERLADSRKGGWKILCEQLKRLS